MDLLGLHTSVLGWEPCGKCDGRKKVTGGRGGERCPGCWGIGMVPLLVLEGALTTDLYLDRATSSNVGHNCEPSPGRRLEFPSVPFSLAGGMSNAPVK